MSAWVVIGACATHSAATGVELTASYRLLWDGREVGREDVRRVREARWVRWAGTLTQREPLQSQVEWEVLLEPRTRELLGFEVAYTAAGETLRTQGWVDGGALRVEKRGFGAREASVLGHGPGTLVELGSPLSGWWGWQRGAETAGDARTLVVRAPGWWPRIETTAVRRVEDAIRVEGPGRERSDFTVDDDGVPRRVVTQRDGWPRALVRERTR